MLTLLFLFLGCAGELVIPAVVAAFLDKKPQVFLWVVMTYSSVSLFCLLVLMIVQHLLLKYQRKEEIEMQKKPESNQVAKSYSSPL